MVVIGQVPRAEPETEIHVPVTYWSRALRKKQKRETIGWGKEAKMRTQLKNSSASSYGEHSCINCT